MRDLPRLGVPQNDYNVDRNIVGSIPDWLRRTRPIDRHRIASAIAWRIGRRGTDRRRFSFSRPYLLDCDLFHFFNTVADVRRPWITTFETSLPRWGDQPREVRRRGLRLLGSDSCHRLIAMSDAARRIAASDWRDELPADEARRLCDRTEVLLPPQAVLQAPEDRPPGRRLELAFIGHDFYRKGGLEVLEALHRLAAAGCRDWHALVVGNLDALGDYATRSDDACRRRARDLLAALSGTVEYHPRLPNAAVLERLKTADYYLLPTLADTFGYSILEAQACGAVVVTTNVRALPEMVDGDSGHVIELPLDERWNAHTLPDFPRTRVAMIDLLEATLRRCREESPEARLAKARAATANLRRRHDPRNHRHRLESLYRQAIEGRRRSPAP